MVALPNEQEPFVKPGFTGSLYFHVDQVDELWDRLKSKARVCYPIEDFEHGMREFAVYDNNGYRLQFGRESSTPIGWAQAHFARVDAELRRAGIRTLRLGGASRSASPPRLGSASLRAMQVHEGTCPERTDGESKDAPNDLHPFARNVVALRRSGIRTRGRKVDRESRACGPGEQRQSATGRVICKEGMVNAPNTSLLRTLPDGHLTVKIPGKRPLISAR